MLADDTVAVSVSVQSEGAAAETIKESEDRSVDLVASMSVGDAPAAGTPRTRRGGKNKRRTAAATASSAVLEHVMKLADQTMDMVPLPPMAVLQNHSAGRDAFCTGFLAARYAQKLGGGVMSEAANKLYLIGKSFPLLLTSKVHQFG